MPADLLVVDASLLATVDAQRREIPGGLGCLHGWQDLWSWGAKRAASRGFANDLS